MAAKTIHQRMVSILTDLPAIGKNQTNPQQNFKFRGHDDVLNALNPKLAEHGVYIIPDVLERVTEQRQTARGGIMYEVNLHVRFTFYGADGDSISGSTWGEGTDMGDKATNKAMTMAFKNILNQAFAINTEEIIDPDKHTPEETVRKTPPPKPDERAPGEMGTRQQMTVAEAGAYTSQAGKYKGRTIEDVYREDPKFIIAVAQMERPSKAREAAQVWLAEMERLANDPELPL